MIDVQWQTGVTVDHDPDETERHRFDWTDYLEGETISSATVTGTGCTAGSVVTASPLVTFLLSGGTAGANASVVCQVTTSAGRIAQRTVLVRVAHR